METQRGECVRTELFEKVIVDILKSKKGKFITAYQVCREIELKHPGDWKRLISRYGSKFGEKAGVYFSAASFISKAVYHFKFDLK